jgi:hypothetical protein
MLIRLSCAEWKRSEAGSRRVAGLRAGDQRGDQGILLDQIEEGDNIETLSGGTQRLRCADPQIVIFS